MGNMKPTTISLWQVCRTTHKQLGDRWVSYGNDPGMGYVPIHSAIVMEVTNGVVTKVKAKCGYGNICTYNPNCSTFNGYMTNDVRYYR
jgi:hypothetical protein